MPRKSRAKLVDPGPGPEEALLAREWYLSLSGSERDALRLSLFYGMSAREVACALRIPAAEAARLVWGVQRKFEEARRELLSCARRHRRR